MAFVICLHPGSREKAISCGLEPNSGDRFVLLEDAVLTHDKRDSEFVGKTDAEARGICVDGCELEDGELIDLIFEHSFTFTC